MEENDATILREMKLSNGTKGGVWPLLNMVRWASFENQVLDPMQRITIRTALWWTISFISSDEHAEMHAKLNDLINKTF
jgi:hypothetical protein